MQIKTRILNVLRLFFKWKSTEVWLRKKIIAHPNSRFFYKLAPNNYQYRKPTFRTFLYDDKVKLTADISDYVGHFLYFGLKDPGHDALYDLVKENDTVLDVGTNIGSTLLMMASKVKLKGHVYGFEPDPINFENAIQNIKLNDLSNISLSPIGLGNVKGSFHLKTENQANRGMNRISLQKSESDVIAVEIDTLDGWIEENKNIKVDLIKIDVEGFEYKVLLGAKKLLKQKPTLFIELDDANLNAVGDTASGLVELLENSGYMIYNSINNTQLSSSDNFLNCHFNIIAKPK